MLYVIVCFANNLGHFQIKRQVYKQSFLFSFSITVQIKNGIPNMLDSGVGNGFSKDIKISIYSMLILRVLLCSFDSEFHNRKKIVKSQLKESSLGLYE